MNKKRVLIVSFYYPPISSIASNRIYSFVKYLNKDIFDIDVVTVKSKEAIDYKIFDNVSIYRISKNPLDYYLDSSSKNIFIRKLKALYNILIKNIFFKLWQVKSIKVILKLNKQKNYDIILSSYAPKESHLIALKIKSKYTNIKWIADMRDEMSLNPFISAKEKKSLQIIEQNIFKHCDAITTVSKPILDDFKKLSNNTKNILFREIRNGYDFDINYKSIKNEKFIISYVGSFYGKIKADNFFKALYQFMNKYKVNDIEVRVVGNNNALIIPKELNKYVKKIGLVSHEKALEYMQISDALLLVHPDIGRKGVYTGKLFEYLAMQKIIIATIQKDSVAAELIKKANAGFIANYSNIDEIVEILYKSYSLWKNNKKLDFNLEIIKKHHRKEQVNRLEQLIKEIM